MALGLQQIYNNYFFNRFTFLCYSFSKVSIFSYKIIFVSELQVWINSIISDNRKSTCQKISLPRPPHSNFNFFLVKSFFLLILKVDNMSFFPIFTPSNVCNRVMFVESIKFYYVSDNLSDNGLRAVVVVVVCNTGY